MRESEEIQEIAWVLREPGAPMLLQTAGLNI